MALFVEWGGGGGGRGMDVVWNFNYALCDGRYACGPIIRSLQCA